MSGITLKAKEKQTLQGHLEDCLKVFMCAKKGYAWERAFPRLDYDPSRCLELLAFLIYTHDLGKATERWQHYLDTGKGRITHSLFSALMLEKIMGKEIFRTPEGAAALLAVLAHHSMLHEGAFSGESVNGLGAQKVPLKKVNDILRQFPEAFKLNGRTLDGGSFTGSDGARLVSFLRRRVQEMKPGEKLNFKGLYTLFLSVLQLCDNEASYQYDKALKKNNGNLLRSVVHGLDDWVERSHNKIRYVASPRSAFSAFLESTPGKRPNKIQQAVAGEANLYLILQAGCGIGKTAAALHFITSWALKGEVDRGIITLPTRFTTNSIFWDFHRQYGLHTEHTGIYHGEMESVLLSGEEDEREEKDRHLRDLKFENSFFNRPLNVCTVDHLLYSLLHCHKYADRAFGNLMTAAVVFDEIHFYDEFTLSKIGQCMQLLRQLKVPHMVMSATIPESVVKHLQEEAGYDGVEYTFIRQDSVFCGEEDTPFYIEKCREPLVLRGEVSGELLSLLDKNISLRQMVVVNQVERAKVVAREIRCRWPRVNVVCYHSEFCRTDRDEKERVIRALFHPEKNIDIEKKKLLSAAGFASNDQVILVSTQICEMSLDISADVMYSEIAPADVIVQRGGRLHRRGRYPSCEHCRCSQCRRLPEGFEYFLYLFPLPWGDPKSHLPYKGDSGGKNLPQKSWDIISGVHSFSNVARWVNELYPVAPKMKDHTMQSMILEDAVFGRRPAERFGQEYGEVSHGSFCVRHSDVATITVVPADRLPLNGFDPLDLVKNHGVRVSLPKLKTRENKWKVLEIKRDGVKYKINVLELPYSKELGFEFY